MIYRTLLHVVPFSRCCPSELVSHVTHLTFGSNSGSQFWRFCYHSEICNAVFTVSLTTKVLLNLANGVREQRPSPADLERDWSVGVKNLRRQGDCEHGVNQGVNNLCVEWGVVNVERR